jgi:hypothetical protein
MEDSVPTRVFLGYGYNKRDQWIEDKVFPILQALGLQILHGKDMHGEQLQVGVKDRIDQSDALIGFCTFREGHENEAFNTHPWVRDEMAYGLGRRLPIIEVREDGVSAVAGLIGDRQRIVLVQSDRLACVTELVTAVSNWSARKLQLIQEARVNHDIEDIVRDQRFAARYRTRRNGIDSQHRPGRVERITGGIYMHASVPDDALIEVEGLLNGRVVFSSDWESLDAVQVPVRVYMGG